MAWLLNAVYGLLLILVSPWILWRRVAQGRYRRGWHAKLWGEVARPPSCDRTDKTEVVWFHAVSVGELQVIRPLIEVAQRERPSTRIVITTSTDSGYELACKLFAQHTVSFAPLDFSWAVDRAIDRIQPTLLVLAELELWPNWINAVHNRGIPIAVINARLSAASQQGYRRIGWISRAILHRIDWIGAQSETYRRRFVELGSDPERVVVTGNIKFDGASPDRTHPEVERRRGELGLCREDIVWLCGSTQSPEEALCLEAYARLIQSHPKLKLMVVPRHAERFDEVAAAIASTGLPWLRRSQMTLCSDLSPNRDWRIFLADSVGELRWWWGLAEIGFVGGSFGSRGGQNMIEPCAYGVVTCFGPNTRNFVDVVQILIESQSAVQLTRPEELAPWIDGMLSRPTDAIAMSKHAIETVSSQRGAVERTWSTLVKLLESRSLHGQSLSP
jgi:3-deoxy-D-manno-octulosonic-acid transferase